MVRTKKRRRIVCGGRNYVWYVIADGDDYDYWESVYINNWETPFLHIISEDKRIILTLPLGVPKPYAVSKGREFQGKPKSGCWERYPLPFELPGSVTPRFVAEVIEWANSGENIGTLKYGDEGFIL